MQTAASTGQESPALKGQDSLEIEEDGVLGALLKSYESAHSQRGESRLMLCSLLGTDETLEAENYDRGRVDYFRPIDEGVRETLLESNLDVMISGAKVDTSKFREAVDSLVTRNKAAREIQKSGGLDTISRHQLRIALEEFDQSATKSGEWWKLFDAKFPGRLGYACASRAGFSTDGSLAVIYFYSETGVVYGAFHVLEKSPGGNWQLLAVDHRMATKS